MSADDFIVRIYPAGTGISTVGRDNHTPAKIHTSATPFTWARYTTGPRVRVTTTVCGRDFPILAVHNAPWPEAQDCGSCRRVITARRAKPVAILPSRM
jgi:hypothetical protein